MDELIGARVRLRPYATPDRDAFIALVTNIDVMRFVDGALEDGFAQTLFDRFLRGEGPDHVWAVVDDENAYLGHAAVCPKGDTAELLFYFRRRYWGQGFASEVGKLLVTFAFSVPSCVRVIATLDDEHIASQRVCEKIGMELFEEGVDEEGTFLIYHAPRS